MKLRIKGNSIRLRLTQIEVEIFQEKGYVEETIQFGNSSIAQMHYAIQQFDEDEIKVDYDVNKIRISLPKNLAEKWTTTNQVGIEYNLPIGEGDHLFVLVEKDFKCLKPREREDEGDLFPNPAGNSFHS